MIEVDCGGIATDPIDALIKGYIYANQGKGMSTKSLAKKFHVSESRVVRLARGVNKLHPELLFTLDEKWATREWIKENYGFSWQQFANLLRKKKGEIRTLWACTHDRPLGTTFYSLKDVFKAAPKLSKKAEAYQRRVVQRIPELAEKPDDLTEEEYALWLTVLKLRLKMDLFTVRDITREYRIANEETVLQRIKSLRRKRYLLVRRDRKENQGINEYHLLNVPSVLHPLLDQIDPRIREHFKEADE